MFLLRWLKKELGCEVSIVNPKISIIVPVHNVEAYLNHCIRSILSQTITDFEVILVNDGSTDKSGKICDEFALQDKRIKVIHQEYGGVSSARNIGIKKAKGNYIGFVDGDDRINPEMYKRLHDICLDTESDISICKLGREINGKLINESEEKLYIKEMTNIEAMEQLFRGILFRFSLCNKLFKKTCFKDIQFPEGRIHEDLSTTYKLFANANKAAFTNYIGYVYVRREQSILTSTYNENRLDAFIGWNEILPFIKEQYPHLKNEVLCSFVYWCIDNVHYIFGQVNSRTEAKRYLRTIQYYLRRYYKDILTNNQLAFKNKYFVALVMFDIKILLFSISYKNFFESFRAKSNLKIGES